MVGVPLVVRVPQFRQTTVHVFLVSVLVVAVLHATRHDNHTIIKNAILSCTLTTF